MSKSRAVQRIDPSTQQLQQAPSHDYELREAEASASAQAGLNLNIFAALSGSLFSRSKKTTETKPDGSSHSVEHRQTAAVADGHGQGNLAVMGQGTMHTKQRDVRAKSVQKVDHLGIEG